VCAIEGPQEHGEQRAIDLEKRPGRADRSGTREEDPYAEERECSGANGGRNAKALEGSLSEEGAEGEGDEQYRCRHAGGLGKKPPELNPK